MEGTSAINVYFDERELDLLEAAVLNLPTDKEPTHVPPYKRGDVNQKIRLARRAVRLYDEQKRAVRELEDFTQHVEDTRKPT